MEKSLYERVTKWCEENPVKYYGHYDDELPDDVVSALLEGNQNEAFDHMWEHEIRMADYNDYSYELDNLFSELDLDDPESAEDGEEWEKLKAQREEAREAFYENRQEDFSDFWKTAARNTDCRVTVTLLHNGGEIYPPHWECGEDENQERERILFELFGMTKEDCDKIEATYSSEVLKLCGSIDIRPLLKYGAKITNKVTLRQSDAGNLLFHDSWNGSGSMGDLIIRKEEPITLECRVRLDKAIKYGVDEVYGFTGSFWSHEIDLAIEAPEEREEIAA